jgi:hypothetical protein
MKICILFLITFFTFTTSFGKITNHSKQKTWPFYDSEEGGFNPERLIYGGNLGVDFIKNDGITVDRGYQLFLSGVFGYRFKQRTTLGISATYIYLNYSSEYKNFLNRDVWEKISVKDPGYSISAFMRFFLLRNMFISAEPEMNYRNTFEQIDEKNSAGASTGRFLLNKKQVKVPVVLVGVGFVIPVGQNSAFILQSSYDVIQDKNSPYNNLPSIRGGFNIGMF